MTCDELLIEAVHHLSKAAEGEELVLSCTQGLRFLILAVSPGEALDPNLTAEVSRLLCAAAPLVAEQAAGHLSMDHVVLGLDCANASLSCQGPERGIGVTWAARVRVVKRAHQTVPVAKRGMLVGLPISPLRGKHPRIVSL